VFRHAEAIRYFACYAKPLTTKAIITETITTSTQVIQSDKEHIQAEHNEAQTYHHILPITRTFRTQVIFTLAPLYGTVADSYAIN